MQRPQNPLSCEIGTLAGAWLCIRCADGHLVDYPLKLMARRYHPGLTIWSVTKRLRCKQCRQRPVSVMLAETPYATSKGRAGADIGWKIELLPDKGRGPPGRPLPDTL